jgi:UDP-glucose 4-epimerase
VKLCVTGGAGYIGSIVSERLLELGHEITVLDNLSTGHRAAVPEGCRLVEGDVRDAQALAQAIDPGTNAVLHFAARSLVGESVEKPLDYFDNNVTGAVALLRAMHARGTARIVFSSSAAVYGAPASLPIEEDAPRRPENPYGWSKLMVEEILAASQRAWGLSWAALRYFNAGGSTERLGEDHRPETHLIPIVLDVAMGRRDALTVFGDDYDTPDGTCIRDYIHVSDLAEAHVLALDAMAGGFSGALNLGSEAPFTVLEVARRTEALTGRPVARRVGPRRSGDPPALVASSRRAEETLGWRKRKSDLDTIIRSAYEWRLRHPDGYPA